MHHEAHSVGQVTGRRGKRAASDVDQPHQRWALSPHAAAASPAAAGGQPSLPQHEAPPSAAPGPPTAAPGGLLEQPSAAPQPQDEVMTESEAAAGGDVAMEQEGPSGQPEARPSSGSLSDSGRASSFSPFSIAPPANESTSEESDTESDQSRDKKVGLAVSISALWRPHRSAAVVRM